VHAIRGSASAPTAEHQRRRPRMRVIARASTTANSCAGRALSPSSATRFCTSSPGTAERSSPNLGHAIACAKHRRASSSSIGHDRRSTTPSRTKPRRGAIPFIDRPDLSWTNNETPPAINRGCSAQMVLAPVTVVVVALFGLARLVDQRRLGGVELQTRVPCSYPAL
jgi:hypothetical protein